MIESVVREVDLHVGVLDLHAQAASARRQAANRVAEPEVVEQPHSIGLDRVSRDSDLFSLGADSIHLFQIAARANRKGIGLSARQLLNHRTVAAVAALLETEGNSPSTVAESRPNPLRRLYPISAKGRGAT